MNVKDSFTVIISKYSKDAKVQYAQYVLGVTSIVPNMNGVLLFTKNRHDVQIPYYEMDKRSPLYVQSWTIEYSTDEQIKEYFEDADEYNTVLDCRA